jgi:hypothetical protein
VNSRATPKVADLKLALKFTFSDVNRVVEGKRFAVSPPFLDVNQVAPTNGGAKVPPTL